MIVTVRTETFTAAEAAAARPALIPLLRDSVDGGASVGPLPPLDEAEAAAYWRSIEDAVASGSLETRPNGRHRAEVMKVMVLATVRRQGIGRAPMDALEHEARRPRRTTLVLDTRAGAIPKYAQSAGGPEGPE